MKTLEQLPKQFSNELNLPTAKNAKVGSLCLGKNGGTSILTPDGPKDIIFEHVDWYVEKMQEFDQGNHSEITRQTYSLYLFGEIDSDTMIEAFEEEDRTRSSTIGI